MSPQPEWIPDFVERVCAALQLFDDGSPLGCHFHKNESGYEISLFFSPTEIVGGPADGRRIISRFVLDIMQLITVLDVIDSVTWQPQVIDQDDDLGAHVSISGIYKGESVWLRILGETPEQFLPGRLAMTVERTFVNIWEE